MAAPARMTVSFLRPPNRCSPRHPANQPSPLLPPAIGPPEVSTYHKIVSLATVVFSRDAHIRSSFWETEHTERDGMHLLLHNANSRFPDQFLPFVKLLSALASGGHHPQSPSHIHCARKVCHLLW